MRIAPFRLLTCAAALLLVGVLLHAPHGRAFSTLGHSLGIDQRDVRVFNNFADPEANDNTTPHASWPGATGAPMAVWKSISEWGSALHGDGEGDPSQPGDVGSGGALYDPTWQGLAPDVGSLSGNVVSAISGCGGGILSVVEWGPGGWRIRLCEEVLWDDGPGTQLAPGALDIQGVLAHEFGHVLGLGHSTVAGATMTSTLGGTGVAARSIEADDAAGVQFVYGAVTPGKPTIEQALSSVAFLRLVGGGFAATGNEVWLTRAGLNPDGQPVVVAGLVSSQGGTVIELATPALAGPGDVLVRIPGAGGAAFSNAFPVDPGECASPQVYCTAKLNSQGCLSAISASGTPSAGAGSGFVVGATQVLSQVSGVLFYGRSGPAAAPFQGGLLCVQPPVTRTTGQSSGGSLPPGSDCTGSFAFDFNAWIAGGADPALTVGQPVWAQYWSRDPGFAPPDHSGLTDALSFLICP